MLVLWMSSIMRLIGEAIKGLVKRATIVGPSVGAGTLIGDIASATSTNVSLDSVF